MSWTQERIETMCRLWQQGHTATEIARTLKVFSRSAVLGKLHRLRRDIRCNPSTPRRVKKKPAKRLPSIAASDSKNERGRVKGRPATARGFGRKAKAEAIDPAHIPATAITLDELPARGRCRWPHGDPAKDEFRFCGQAPGKDEEGSARVYCDHHRKIAYVPSKPKRKRCATLEAYLDYQSSKRRVYA